MKLYLSSYKLGQKTEVLEDWLKDHDSKIGLIINARDIFPDGERKESRIKSDTKEEVIKNTKKLLTDEKLQKEMVINQRKYINRNASMDIAEFICKELKEKGE